MSSTFLGLEIGRSGLNSASLNINTTGNNIANADTDGYTRQRVTNAEKVPSGCDYVVSQIYNKLSGQGVSTTGIEQIRSDYLDAQYRSNNSNYNYTEYKAQGNTYMEGLMNELDTDSSLTLSINSFYEALGEYASQDTTSEEFRTNVQQQAVSMTENFNSVYNEMKSLWESQNDSISTVADTINTTTQQLADLNKQIARYETSGTTANALRDQRNLLLDNLSGLVNVDYSVNSDNSSMVDVSIGGVSVVDGSKSSDILVGKSSQVNDASGEYTNTLKVQTRVDENGVAIFKTLDLNEEVTSGELYAHMELTEGSTDGNEGIPYYMNQLNGLAQHMSQAINDLHTEGYTYPDAENENVSQKGVLFFDVDQAQTKSGILLMQTANKTQVYADSSNNLFLAEPDTSGNAVPLTTTVGGVSYNLSLSPDGTYFIGKDQLGVAPDANLIQEASGAAYYALMQTTDASGNTINQYTNAAGKTQTVELTDSAIKKAYDYSKVTAGNFAISKAIKDSVWNIACASSAEVADNSGDNEVITSIFKTLEDQGFNDELDSIVAHFAISTKSNTDLLDTNQKLVDSVDAQRTSLSGVSMDEETTNLIQFKQMYSVCSRMITTEDDMLSTLINNTGRVGL